MLGMWVVWGAMLGMWGHVGYIGGVLEHVGYVGEVFKNYLKHRLNDISAANRQCCCCEARRSAFVPAPSTAVAGSCPRHIVTNCNQGGGQCKLSALQNLHDVLYSRKRHYQFIRTWQNSKYDGTVINHIIYVFLVQNVSLIFAKLISNVKYTVFYLKTHFILFWWLFNET